MDRHDLLEELTRAEAHRIAECIDAEIMSTIGPVPEGWAPPKRSWWGRTRDGVTRWWRKHWRLRVRWEREEG